MTAVMSATTSAAAAHAPVSFSSGAAAAYQVRRRFSWAAPASCRRTACDLFCDLHRHGGVGAGRRDARGVHVAGGDALAFPACQRFLWLCAGRCQPASAADVWRASRAFPGLLPLPCSPRRRRAVRGGRREAAPRPAGPHDPRRMRRRRARLMLVSGLPRPSRPRGGRRMRATMASRRPDRCASRARLRGARPAPAGGEVAQGRRCRRVPARWCARRGPGSRSARP